jgi:hypothetical protein
MEAAIRHPRRAAAFRVTDDSESRTHPPRALPVNTSDPCMTDEAVELEAAALDQLEIAERSLRRKVNRFAAMAASLAPIVSSMSETFAAREDAQRITEVLAWIASDYRRHEKRLDRLRRDAKL